jgi:hypothetical protein
MTLRTRVERALTASCSAALAVKGNLGGSGETIGETRVSCARGSQSPELELSRRRRRGGLRALQRHQ